MTSNVGARNITDKQKKLGFAAVTDNEEERSFENIKSAVLDELKRVFKPEFLNRVDETIVFRQLTRENIREISQKMLETVIARVKTMGIEMTADDAAIDLLSEKGFDPIYGARPLRRAIQNAVEDAAAEKILEGSIKEGDKVTVTVVDGKIELVTDANKEPAKAGV
jgi:ATP-dependent Clp protease ATP-binding subunit ClpC